MPLAHNNDPNGGSDEYTLGRPPCPGRIPPGSFRLTIHDGASEFRLAAEGHITVLGAEEMDRCWRTAASTVSGRRFVVDLGGATSIDDDALRALNGLRDEGARWITARPRMSIIGVLSCLAYRLRLISA